MAELDELLVREHNRFRGQMCGLVESFGLPERQETAAKQMIKSLSYDHQAHLREYLDDLAIEESPSA